MAKPTKRPVDNAVGTPALESASQTPNQSFGEVTDRDIACRAFDLYCQRGRQDGRDRDDWLKAERELRGGIRSTVARVGIGTQRLP
jgi:hypothetical protein